MEHFGIKHCVDIRETLCFKSWGIVSTMNHSVVKEISYTFLYKGSTIPYAVWCNVDEGTSIETIIFLGTVQIDHLGRWVAEDCPPNTIVVQGAPHWFAKSDGSDIPEYMYNFTKSVFETLLKNFSVSENHIIAESQAVPGVLGLFKQKGYIPYVKKLTLLQPLGLNAHIYKGTDTQRIETFRHRITANFLHQLMPLLTDERLRYNHRVLHRLAGGSMRNPKTRAQYSSGLAHDAISDLKYLYEYLKNVTIICGANDKIFPPTEIRATLSKNEIGIPVQIIKGIPHSPLASRYGKKLLSAAMNV